MKSPAHRKPEGRSTAENVIQLQAKSEDHLEKLVSKSIAVLVACVLALQAQTPAQEHPVLDDQRVVTLSKSLSSIELVSLVMSAPDVSFDLSPASMDGMMKAGVSEDVIKAMAARANGKPAAPPSVPVAKPVAAAPPLPTITTPAKPAAHTRHSGNSYNITYDGGSLPNLKAGTSLKLFIDSDQLVLEKDHNEVLTIIPASVMEISYGQDVHRRVGAAIGLALISFGIGALMALTKSKKHYVGLTWASGEEKGGFAMKCDKSDYRGVLAGLQGVTGKKAVDTDALTVKN